MAGAPKGAALEELVRAYFARQGFFALRGVSFRFDDEEVTDIDVWLYGRQSASLRTRTIVDVKDKRSPKAFERILWTRGVQLALGCDRGVVATTDTNPKIVRFAQQQKVALLTRQFLERLQKNVSTETRQSAEQFAANIQSNPNHKQDGDWLRRIADAKSALISLSGYPAFNKAISTFRFFGERVETRALHREQALRGAYIAAALACIALDSALERSVYEDTAARFRSIANGVTYGDAGDGRVQSSIDSVLTVLSGAMENGRVVATQARDAFEQLFEQVRSDIIAEFFSREHNSVSLFTVARELDERAHSIDPSTLLELSTEAKSVLGVFADFAGVKRGLLFGGQFHRGQGHSGSEGGQSKLADDKPPSRQDKLL